MVRKEKEECRETVSHKLKVAGGLRRANRIA